MSQLGSQLGQGGTMTPAERRATRRAVNEGVLHQGAEAMLARQLAEAVPSRRTPSPYTPQVAAAQLATARRLSDLVSTVPVGIAVFDEQGRIVQANAALCSLLDETADRLHGRLAATLTEDGASWPEWLRAVPAGPEHVYRTGPVALRRPDGDTLWCELSASVSVAENGGRCWLVVFTDVDRRQRATQLRPADAHDELTKLPNRLAASQLIASLLERGEDHQLAVLYCDLDDFRRINDSLGHEPGDELLVTLAARLRSELPAGCTAARLSGGEFVVICADTDAVGGVETLVTFVRDLFRTTVPVRGQQVRISASIGVAVTVSGTGATGHTPADLLRFADAATYAAKQGGAGQVHYADEEIIGSASRQVELEAELRAAIANDELVLHYQPVVSPDGTIRSAEALVRWPHPERGLLNPADFLGVAARGDLLSDLDRWVLRTATKEAAGWPRHQGHDVAVAVNLAGLLPGHPGFLPTVAAAVTESGLCWDRLVLELVETSLVSLPQNTLAVMAELTNRGVRFAVDDFGTGYSSLARLRDLPAQIVKVDRAFVTRVASDPADYAVARAVVQMARALGRSCVAEGVETADQFHILHSIGVDAHQGWLLAKAMEPALLRTLLSGGPLPTPLNPRAD
ncbi:MAG: EAL domain-containing protein [Pseudonocardiales bacterium]|nr:EAL domain-containing protein [Pseudonocardiales bacterium]